MKFTSVKTISRLLKEEYEIDESNYEKISTYVLSMYGRFRPMLDSYMSLCCQDSIEDCSLELQIPCNAISIDSITHSYWGQIYEYKNLCYLPSCQKGYIIDHENDLIKTNIDSGKVSITYSYIPIDDDGYIKIPDDQLIIDAILSYIANKLLRGLILKKVITERAQIEAIKEDYLEKMKALEHELKRVKRGDMMKIARVTLQPLKPSSLRKDAKVIDIQDGLDSVHFITYNKLK